MGRERGGFRRASGPNLVLFYLVLGSDPLGGLLGAWTLPLARDEGLKDVCWNPGFAMPHYTQRMSQLLQGGLVKWTHAT